MAGVIGGDHFQFDMLERDRDSKSQRPKRFHGVRPLARLARPEGQALPASATLPGKPHLQSRRLADAHVVSNFETPIQEEDLGHALQSVLRHESLPQACASYR